MNTMEGHLETTPCKIQKAAVSSSLAYMKNIKNINSIKVEFAQSPVGKVFPVHMYKRKMI